MGGLSEVMLSRDWCEERKSDSLKEEHPQQRAG